MRMVLLVVMVVLLLFVSRCTVCCHERCSSGQSSVVNRQSSVVRPQSSGVREVH